MIGYDRVNYKVNYKVNYMGKLIIFDLDDCLVDTWGSMFPQLTNQAVEEMVKAGLKVLSFEKAAKRLAEIKINSKTG